MSTKEDGILNPFERIIKSELAKYGLIGAILIWFTWTKTTDDRRYFEAMQKNQDMVLNIVRDNTEALTSNAKAIEELTKSFQESLTRGTRWNTNSQN